jgi:hypothetical protein
MKSHQYEFNLKDVLRVLGLPLTGLGVFGALMHLGAAFNILPAPRPALDLDRTILIHQAEAARSRQEAEIILLGDSSCLMDVMADQLSDQLGRPVLNLGTVSYLDLKTHARLLHEFVRSNPGQLREVVLLMHPEALRRTGAEAYQQQVVEHFLAGRDHCPPGGMGAQAFCWLGLEIFRARLVGRLIPPSLTATNAYGRFYRFTTELERFITRHRGSMIEPAKAPLTGSPEYRLAAVLERDSRAFAAVVPKDVKLFVGITPAPDGFVGADFPLQQTNMLAQWSQWLGGEPLSLPASLPDEHFGRVTHLTASGARLYTQVLAQSLTARLRPQSPMVR